MTKIIIRLSDRIMRLWIMNAIRILKENKQDINFTNVLLEIEEFDNMWIRTGLSEQDKKDIEKTYNEMGIEEGR